MSDFDKIFPAITQWAESYPDLIGNNAFTGIFDDIPPKGQKFPYLVVFNITSGYSPATGQEVDEDIYQFSGFDGNSVGRQRSSRRLMRLMALLENKFHNKAVAVPGVRVVKFTRDTKGKSGDRDQGWLVWQRYQVWTQDS